MNSKCEIGHIPIAEDRTIVGCVRAQGDRIKMANELIQSVKSNTSQSQTIGPFLLGFELTGNM
jgi:hypothetical protein